MNPIGLAALAMSSGCGAGLVWFLTGLRAAKETAAVTPPPEPEPEPVNDLDADREDWGGELAEFGKELADVRKKRSAVQAVRVDTLRGIYLAGLEIDAERPEEVPAR